MISQLTGYIPWRQKPWHPQLANSGGSNKFAEILWDAHVLIPCTCIQFWVLIPLWPPPPDLRFLISFQAQSSLSGMILGTLCEWIHLLVTLWPRVFWILTQFYYLPWWLYSTESASYCLPTSACIASKRIILGVLKKSQLKIYPASHYKQVAGVYSSLQGGRDEHCPPEMWDGILWVELM